MVLKNIPEDTLYFGKRNFGDLYSIKILHDSINRDLQEDVRGVSSCLKLHNLTNDVDYNSKSCDSFYQAELDFEKVRIPFYVFPEKGGWHYLKGVLKERILLNAYKYKDSTETRYIELEHKFELPVYVKKEQISQGKL